MAEVQTGGHQAIGELIKKLRGLLARFASKIYAHDAADPETGVLVQYNRAKRNEVAFELTTADKITVRVVFDLNETSRGYIAGMVKGVKDGIEAKRKERAEASPIIIPTASQMSVAIKGSIH